MAGSVPLTCLNRRALGGTRTPNLLIRSQVLYPLSYERLSDHHSGPTGQDYNTSG